MEIGLVLIRAVLVLVLFAHAAQKLFGWFSGNGVAKQGELFESLGLRPGRTMVAVAGASELVAATLLLFGFLAPLGALMAAGTMTVAGVTMHLNSGKFWNVAGGGSTPMCWQPSRRPWPSPAQDPCRLMPWQPTSSAADTR